VTQWRPYSFGEISAISIHNRKPDCLVVVVYGLGMIFTGDHECLVDYTETCTKKGRQQRESCYSVGIARIRRILGN